MPQGISVTQAVGGGGGGGEGGGGDGDRGGDGINAEALLADPLASEFVSVGAPGGSNGSPSSASSISSASSAGPSIALFTLATEQSFI